LSAGEPPSVFVYCIARGIRFNFFFDSRRYAGVFVTES